MTSNFSNAQNAFFMLGNYMFLKIPMIWQIDYNAISLSLVLVLWNGFYLKNSTKDLKLYF